ncbi:phage capsid protein [Macrococcoides goetzii]|nr:phage capsid protein [Macrococcus goetzii]TDM41827.1 phage capsid protein [Macrococcus goetzii]
MKTNLALKLNIQHFATPSYPEQNLQTTLTLDKFKEKSIDFTARFGTDMINFKDVIGITRLLPVNEGMTIEFYGGLTVALADGKVPEGELIPLSTVTPIVEETKKMELDKWRKATTGEAIQKYGLSQAINLTDAAMIREAQKNVRARLFGFVQGGQVKDNLSSGLQGALATAWGAVQTVFEDDAVKTVVFAHPNDVATANAHKQISMETAFGLNYYTDLTGTLVIVTPQVTEGSIYATAADNLVLAYIPAGSSELGQSFDLSSDSTGFIGMTHFLHHETLTHQTLVVSGILMFPERLDGVVKVVIGDEPGATAPAVGA